MSDSLQIFQFNNHALRVIIDENGGPWFIAKDVSEILDYSDAYEMTKKLDEDEKSNRQIAGLGTETGGRGITLINESGLYSSVLTSQKPEAKTFKRWVTHEVLPSIRKHGYYANPQQPKASFDDMPGELPPFQRVKPSLLIKLGKMSKSLAQAYLVECGVTPDYVQQQLSQLGAAAPTLGVDSNETPAVLVARFVDDWKSQLIAAPFAPCLGLQALRLFHVWANNKGISVRHGDNLLLSALYQHSCLYGKRYRIEHGGHAQLKRMLMVEGQKPPVNVSYTSWLIGCVADMEAALNKMGVS